MRRMRKQQNTVLAFLLCLKGFCGSENPQKPSACFGLCGLHFFWQPLELYLLIISPVFALMMLLKTEM